MIFWTVYFKGNVYKEEIFLFQERYIIKGQLPRVRQMWYCVCDVRLPLAEEIVRKEYFAQGDRADDQYGWLPPVSGQFLEVHYCV